MRISDCSSDVCSSDLRPVDFARLRKSLQETVQAVTKIAVDFTETRQGSTVTQQTIDTAMAFDSQTATHKEYIDALLGYCANDLFDTVLESPFTDRKSVV